MFKFIVKSSPHLLCVSSIALSFASCDSPTSPTPPKPESNFTSSSKENKSEVAVVEEAEKTVTLPAKNDFKIDSQYGFISILPKNTEGFTASYRLQQVWDLIAKSNWSSNLQNLLESIQKDPQFQNSPAIGQLQQGLFIWNNPIGLASRQIIGSLLGNEIDVVMPEGFGEKMKPLIAAIYKWNEKTNGSDLRKEFNKNLDNSPIPELELARLEQEGNKESILAFAKCELPPLYMVFKAINSKNEIDLGINSVISSLRDTYPEAAKEGTFKVDNQHDFNFFHLTGKSLLPADLKSELVKLMGDEAKADEAINLFSAKDVELSWGWVGDYFVFAIGQNHEHIKLVSDVKNSALSITEVAKHSSQFAGKNPIHMDYISKPLFENLTKLNQLSYYLNILTEGFKGIITPAQFDEVRSSSNKLVDQSNNVFDFQYDPWVSVVYLDNGLQIEGLGGQRFNFNESNKPLSFSDLDNSSVFLFLDAHSFANSKKVYNLIENISQTTWGWYEKFGIPLVPTAKREYFTTFEMMGAPTIKKLWNAGLTLNEGLGNESAFLMDFEGQMPTLPQVPPFYADGKIPRLAWISVLKDRALVSKAWDQYQQLIAQMMPPQVPQDQHPKPEMIVENGNERYFFPMPFASVDFEPQVMITKDRWIHSSSPRMLADIESKTSAASKSALSANINAAINFSALWNLTATWLKIFEQNADKIYGPQEAQDFHNMQPHLAAALKLARSLVSYKMHVTEDGGQTHAQGHLKVQDVQ